MWCTAQEELLVIVAKGGEIKVDQAGSIVSLFRQANHDVATGDVTVHSGKTVRLLGDGANVNVSNSVNSFTASKDSLVVGDV
jgi:hypothetical protein